MENINNILKKWLSEYKEFSFENYENLPDIDLYMDQVLTILERKLALFSYSSQDKLITSSMINNYVKGKVVSAPISKKYNREHLALIEEVCTLKQVLSIAEIKQIIDSTYANSSKTEVFNHFKDEMKALNNEASDQALSKLENVEANDVKNLNELALSLAVKANAYINIAKRILFLTKHYEGLLQAAEAEKLEQEKED